MSYRAPAWQTLASLTVLALAASALLALARPVEMTVDGVRMESDVPPVTTATNRVFVPLRAFAGALGAQTISDGDAGRVVVVRGRQSLRIAVGNVHASLNGMPITLHHAPFLVRGRIMVEMRPLAAAFGVRARYDPPTAHIAVLTPGVGQSAM